MLPLARSLCKNKAAVIFSVSLWLLVGGMTAFAADIGVELGAEDDFTVFGTGGSVPDPDLEVKGFSIFGSTNVLTYISTAPGNTVFNGAVQVSSDIYVTGRSTFTAPLQIWNPAGFSGNLLNISTGTSNVIRMTGAGEIYAAKFYGDISGATGQSSWNHIAAQNIQLNGYWLSNDGGSEGIRVDNTGQAGVGVAAPQAMLDVGGSAQFGSGAAKSTFTAAGLLQLASALTVSYGGTGGTGLTGNTVLLGNGSNPIATTNLGIADQILRISGAGGAPAFGSVDLSKNAAVGASILGVVNGGTGLAAISAGQLIYGSGSNVFSALAGPAAAGQAMRASGAGSFGWASPLAADIDEAVNRWVDISGDTMTGPLTASSVTATGIGVSAAQLRLASASGVTISSEASAALGGGVRVSTNVYIVGFSSAAMYYGDGAGLTRASPAGSALTSANIWVGSASNLAAAVAMSGDATLSNTGVLTLKNTGTAGTYRSVTTDAQGRVSAGTNPTTFAGYGLSDTSANLLTAITDETGTGALVFATNPELAGIINSGAYTQSGASLNTFTGASTFTGALTASSITATSASLGIGTARLRFTNDKIVVSSASAAQYGGVYVSTNIYISGKYYGDASGLALTSANIWVGSASNLAAAVAMSGDATLSNTGVLTLKNTGTAGTYRSVTTDAQGRVSAGTNPTTFAGYGLSDTSANLLAAITDETGTGVLVFATNPAFAGMTNSGAYTQSGASLNTFTGASTFTGALTASSVTATGIGVSAAQLRLASASGVTISSEASAALGGGVRVSTNVYIVGFSSAAKYYGDGSSLNNIPITDSSKVAKAGDTMTGALTLPGDPASALQAATKQYVDSWTRTCVNSADSNDIMVAVGPWCVDKYEASVWSTATGGTQYGAASDNYPCNDNGQDCGVGAANPIYARSVISEEPAANITWFQANMACFNAGKELLPNAVWQAAASGTTDPGATGSGVNCNVSGGAKENTGGATGCVSTWGAEDMIGNVWEWVAEWGTSGAGASAAMGTMVEVDGTGTGYNNDGQWNIGGNSYTNYAAPAGWIQGQIPAVIRGGYWGNGASAGVFAFYASDAPSLWGGHIGFRCGRRR